MSKMHNADGIQVVRLIDRYGVGDWMNVRVNSGKEYYGEVLAFDTLGVSLKVKNQEGDIVIPWSSVERVVAY